MLVWLLAICNSPPSTSTKPFPRAPSPMLNSPDRLINPPAIRMVPCELNWANGVSATSTVRASNSNLDGNVGDIGILDDSDRAALDSGLAGIQVEPLTETAHLDHGRVGDHQGASLSNF